MVRSIECLTLKTNESEELYNEKGEKRHVR